jgi:hypothetical protein
MDSDRSRAATLIAVAAAAGAFGVAAMMSTATAPTARADLYDDTVDAIDFNLGEGQTAFGVAASDFGSSNVSGGLTALFDGLDDDSLLAPQNAYIGIVDALTNESFSGDSSYYALTQPTDFAQAETLAQSAFTYAESQFADASSSFDAAQFGDAAYFDASGVDAAFVVPLEYLLLGAAASF